MLDFDADELVLRRRVHNAYEALTYRAPSPVWVSARVRAGVAVTAQRQRRTAASVALGASLLLASIVGVRLDPATSQATRPSAQQSAVAETAGHSSRLGALPALCPRKALEFAVSTDRPAYAPGDVVQVSASVRNRSGAACRYAIGLLSVWVTDGGGGLWALCPEYVPPPPPPTPTPTPPPAPHAAPHGAVNPPMAGALVVPQVAAMPSAPIGDIVRPNTALAPGTTTATKCTWHTGWTTVPTGSYTAHAMWSGKDSATNVITITEPFRPLLRHMG